MSNPHTKLLYEFNEVMPVCNIEVRSSHCCLACSWSAESLGRPAPRVHYVRVSAILVRSLVVVCQSISARMAVGVSACCVEPQRLLRPGPARIGIALLARYGCRLTLRRGACRVAATAIPLVVSAFCRCCPGGRRPGRRAGDGPRNVDEGGCLNQI